jgi:hypothetical protein
MVAQEAAECCTAGGAETEEDVDVGLVDATMLDLDQIVRDDRGLFNVS